MTGPVPEWVTAVPSHPGVHPASDPFAWSRPFTAQQLLEIGAQLLEQFLRRVAQALLGVVPGGMAAFDALVAWVQGLPGQIVAGINDLAGIDLSNWENFLASLNDGRGIDLPLTHHVITNIQSFFGNINLAAPSFDPIGAARDFVRTIVQPFIDIFGQIRAALLGPLPIGQLTDRRESMLLEGGFDAPETIVEGSGFTHDGADGVPGSSPLGCAVVECDGDDHSMSSELVRVAPGWRLQVSARLKWVDLVADPGAVTVALQPWADESTPVGSPVTMVSAGAASGTSGGTNGWGSAAFVSATPYEVPESGVQFVTVIPMVSASAASGTVKFDDVSLTATQKIPQHFTVNLVEDLNSLLNWIRTVVEAPLAALGITPSGNLLADIFDLSDELEWLQGVATNAANAAVQALNDIATLASNLLLNPVAVIGNLAGAIIDGVGNTINHLLNLLFGAFTRSVPQGDVTVNEVAEAAVTVADTAVNTAASTETLSTYFYTPREIPAWVGYLTDDVAFQHTLIDGTSTPSLGQLVLIPVRVQQDRTYSAIKLGFDGNSMTTLRIGLYAMDHETGDLTKVLDLGNRKSDLNLAYDMQTFPLSEPIGVQAGEVYYIGVLQTGGTAAPMHRWSSTNNWVTGLYPRWIGNIASGSYSSLPGSVSAANISSGTKYWGALGDPTAAVAPGTKTFSDTFNRADGPAGANWVTRAGSGLYIVSNAAVGGEPASLLDLETEGYASYVSRLETLSQRVRVTIKPNSIPTTGNYTFYTNVALRGNGLGAAVFAQFYRNVNADITRVYIRTASSYSDMIAPNGGTSRGWTESLPSLSGTFDFVAQGNTYRVYQGATQVLEWVDTGNVFPVTSTFTEVGLGGNRQFVGDAGLMIDSWSAADI